MECVFRCAAAEVIPLVSEPAHIFTKASSMHPTSKYPVTREILQPERTVVLDAESQVEETIASLKQHFEEVRQGEVNRTRGRLGELSCTQENAIESLSRGIIDQILNTPIAVLKASYGNRHFVLHP